MSNNYKLIDSTENTGSCAGCCFDVNNMCDYPKGATNAGCYQNGYGIYIEHSDPVNQPSHYTSGSIECIDAIKASMSDEAFKGFLKGNCQKYLHRYEKKENPKQDLEKAKWYLEKLISLM
jgi:hypothetical protein